MVPHPANVGVGRVARATLTGSGQGSSEGSGVKVSIERRLFLSVKKQARVKG